MKNKKLLTLALTVLMLLTFSLSCFAAENILHGKYDISNFNSDSFDFDGLEYCDEYVTFTTDTGSTFQGLKIDESGISFRDQSTNSYYSIVGTYLEDIEYLIFDNQSVGSQFYDAFTSCYQLIDSTVSDDTVTDEPSSDEVVSFEPVSHDTVKFSDFGSVLSGTQGQFNVTTILGILALVVGACVVLAFMWWGVRKIIYAVMTAFKKGKISL